MSPAYCLTRSRWTLQVVNGGGGGHILFNSYNLSNAILNFEMARKPPIHIKHKFMPLSYLLCLSLFQGPFSLRNGHVKSLIFNENFQAYNVIGGQNHRHLHISCDRIRKPLLIGWILTRIFLVILAVSHDIKQLQWSILPEARRDTKENHNTYTIARIA